MQLLVVRTKPCTHSTTASFLWHYWQFQSDDIVLPVYSSRERLRLKNSQKHQMSEAWNTLKMSAFLFVLDVTALIDVDKMCTPTLAKGNVFREHDWFQIHRCPGPGLAQAVNLLVVVVKLSNLGGHLPNLPSLQSVATVQHLSVQQHTTEWHQQTTSTAQLAQSPTRTRTSAYYTVTTTT